MKTSEIVYMINDLAKNMSDDASYTEDHIAWLARKYRSLLLRREYEQFRKFHTQANQQTICVDLCPEQGQSLDECNFITLKSIDKIPDMIGSAIPQIYTSDASYSLIVYVSKEKFKYVNTNKFTSSIIYCTIGNDNMLYMKSSNPQFQNLEQIRMSGVFDDFEEAAKLSCDEETGQACDYMDIEFPLQDDLVPQLIQFVLKDLLGAMYRPKDSENNASDDLAHIANFIRLNMKSPLSKQIEGDE